MNGKLGSRIARLPAWAAWLLVCAATFPATAQTRLYHPAVLYRLAPVETAALDGEPARRPAILYRLAPLPASSDSFSSLPPYGWSQSQPPYSRPSEQIAWREQSTRFAQLQQPVVPPDASPIATALQAPAVGGGTGGGTGSAEANSSETPTLGSAPDDYGLQFLREATVLLSPGQWQFDYGLSYTLDDTLVPIVLSDSSLDAARLRRRTLLVPFAFRVGVTPSVQAFVNAPVGWSQAEFANREFDLTENVGGIGDVTAGANILLEPGQQGSPDIVLTAGFVAPTGNDAFGPNVNSAGLGSGYWSAFADLRFIYSYDPVVLFWGAGYRWQFQRKLGDVWLNPGDEITYQLGVGLAINERVTLSTAVFGSVIGETTLAGQGVPGSLLEPIRIRMALTTVTPRKRIVEPFVTFGITPDAANADVGVIVTVF